MRNWRRAAALLLALCMTMLLAACGEDPNDEEKLSVVMTGTVRTMDPAQAVTPAERTVVKHVFENLMRPSAEGAVHAVARSYTEETALDGTVTYTFQLRTDAKWSDGSAVTAGDFVYAWRRLVDPETNSPNADALAMVAGYDKAVLGDTEALQVSAPDDHTFQLRTDAKWSDGSAVTAGDFVYAWRRLVDPETNSPNADALAMVAGYDKAVLGDTEALQVSAPDDHTLVVVLSGSYPSFIESTCTSAVTMPVQEKAVTGHDNWSVSSLWFMGNGAYERTGDWSDSTRLTLHTRAAYYDVKRLGPDRIDIQLKDRQAADASAGKVDIVIGAGGEDAQQGGDPTVGILLLNQMATSMSRSELRRALSLVIDRNAVAEAMGQDYTAAEGLVPYGILTASGEEFRVVNGTRIDNDLDKYEERCQGALALLRQAGYSNAVSLSALDTVTLAYDRTSTQAQAAQQLQQLWEARLGIKVQLVGLESFELKQRLANGEFVIALMEMTACNNDAAAYLDPWRSTDMRNYGMLYLNAYDILMKIAATSNSQEAEDAYLRDAEQLLLETGYVIPLYGRTQPCVIRDGVLGAVSDGLGNWYFGGVTRAS